jgi:hypothetical protein
MERALAPFRGSRPALGHRNRVELFPPSNPLAPRGIRPRSAAAIVGCEQLTRVLPSVLKILWKDWPARSLFLAYSSCHRLPSAGSGIVHLHNQSGLA